MSGFREPEISREQMVLWSRRLDDAIPVDHPVRHMDELLHSEAFRDTFREWERKKGRTVNRDQYEEHRQRLRVRMDTDIGRGRYKLRRQTVEPPLRGSGHGFGLMKHNWGIRRFLRRGLESVHTEWVLICTAVNLGILLKHWEVVKAMG